MRSRIAPMLGVLSLLAGVPRSGQASPPQKPMPHKTAETPTAKDDETTLPPLRVEGPLAGVQTALRSGKGAEAKQLADKLRPTVKEARLRDDLEALVGQSLCAQGLVTEATKHLEAFVAQQPQALASRMALGQAYRRLSLRDKERAVWNSFFDDHDAEKLDMSDPRAVRLLGMAAHYLGSYQDAYEQLTSAITLAKDKKRTDEIVLSSLALSELRIEKYEVGYAEQSVKEALRRDPHNPDAKALLARIKLEQGNDVAEASELVEDSLKVNPYHPVALAIKAEILIDNEQYEEALAVIDPQLARNGFDLPARALRAAALFLLDRPKEYEAEKAETLRRSPLFSSFHRIVSDRLQVQHRYEAQVAVLEEAVKLHPKDFYALGDLGRCYLQLGDDERSYQTLLKAWKGDKYNRKTFNLLELFEKYHQKTYKVINVDIDPRQAGKGGLRIRIHKDEEELLVPLLAPLVQAEYVEFSRRYGFSPKLPISIELYKEPDNFSVRTFGLPSADPGMLGVTFSRVVTGRSPSQGKLPWGLMVWHELGHVFAIELSNGKVPRWFTEGLSEWETMQINPTWSRRTHAEVAAALRDNRLLSMADLNVGFTRARSQSHIVVAYHQAALSVAFLARRFGFPKIVEALKQFGAGKRTREVLEQIAGMPIAKLDEEFRADLRKQLAAYEGTFYIRPSDYADTDGLRLKIRNSPKDAKLQGLLAVAMVRSGADPAESAGQIAVARKLDPRGKEALLADAELQQKLGRTSEAEKLFRELIALGGDGFDVRQRLGDLYSQSKQLPAAMAEYERAKKLDPDRSEPYERLAALYLQDKKTDEALRELAAAAVLDFADDRALVSLIEGHADKKHAKEVIKYADQLLYIAPYRGKSRTQAAEAWQQLGQTQRALQQIEAAKKLLPDPADVEEEEVPKLTAEKTRIEELRRQISKTKSLPFAGPDTLLDAARKKAGLPLSP